MKILEIVGVVCLFHSPFVDGQSPTPAPTGRCDDGWARVGGVCTECPTGQYSINGTACEVCDPGYYANNVGQYTCVECDTGKLANSDHTACEDCDAGRYTFNFTDCVACPFGQYAPTALDDSCLECDAGFYANNYTAATECPACDAGKYSGGNTDTCTDCAVGKYSGNGETSCTDCVVGTFTNSTGSTACSDCAAGKYANAVRSIKCTECEGGKYQEATKQSSCYNCESGTYAKAGAFYCETCDFGYSSTPSSSRCNIADTGYYLLNTTDYSKAAACPKNAYCAGGEYAPAPLEGYWSDRSSYAYTSIIYQCSRGTCQGIEKYAGGLRNTSCWHQHAFPEFYNQSGYIECDADEVLCLDGAWGHICGSCKPGYTFHSQKQKCEECNLAKSNMITLLVIAAGVIFIIVASVLTVRYVPIVRDHAFFRFLAQVDTGSVKVVWVTYQIIASTSFNLDIEYPSPYSELLNAFSFFSFDFLALECFQKGAEQRYYTSLTLWSLTPIVIASLIGIGYFVRLGLLKLTSSNLAPEDLEEKYQRVKVQHVWAFLLLTYLVLPPVAMKQLQSLDCIPFPHDDSSYLRVDTIIDCNGDDYLEFRVYVIIFIILYQLIPLLWLWLLYRQRDALHPDVSSSDPRLALYIRDKDPNLGPIRFLFDSYKCNRWWFEVVEMYRRVIFVSIIPLTSTVVATRASLGCVLGIMSILYYREENPFRQEFTNVIAYVAQAAILITFYAALSIETGIMIDFGLSDFGMGLFLVIVNISVFGLLLHISLKRLREEQKRNALKHANANSLEVAVGFSAEKFATTFGSVTQTVVPASHTLVFYYTTVFGARRALKSGIPAHEAIGGVLVCDKQPHQLTAYDEAFFKKHASFKHSTPDNKKVKEEDAKTNGPFPFEAVLALALPSRVLYRIDDSKFDITGENGKKLKIGSGQTSGLYCVPSELLDALRPNEFTAVIEPTPWADGVLLLPPSPIVRGYQLISEDECSRLNKLFGYEMNRKINHKNFATDLIYHLTSEDFVDEFDVDDFGPTKESEGGGAPPTTVNDEKVKADKLDTEAKEEPSPERSDGDAEEGKGLKDTQDKKAVKSGTRNSGRNSGTSLINTLLGNGSPNANVDKAQKPKRRNTKRGRGLEEPETMLHFTTRMKAIRRRCAASNRVPLYHYTQVSVASLILKTGLRMSRQGQGDGGVYFSTLGPCSYGLGSSEIGSNELYEEMIIKDCFGVERLNEYKGQGKLDVVIVYAISPLALQPAPGGRDNAKVVTKATFQDLSLVHSDGNYFLHPAAVMGAFLIRTSKPLACDAVSVIEAESEVSNDEAIRVKIDEALTNMSANTSYFASKDVYSPAQQFLKRKDK